MLKFNVTYEIITPESAEEGDASERGFIGQKLSLRDTLNEVCSTRTSEREGATYVEASDSDIGAARWINIHNGMEFRTGAYETRSIHFPDNLTRSSRVRIARLLGVA